MTDEQRDQSWNDSAGGLEHLPYGQNDLRAVWKLKRIFGPRSVSPISSHTLLKPSGQPATKANQRFKETHSVLSPGTRASGRSWPTLPCMWISLTKQTSNYVEITLARRLEHWMLVRVWRWVAEYKRHKYVCKFNRMQKKTHTQGSDPTPSAEMLKQEGETERR